jgi:hypothetical protein
MGSTLFGLRMQPGQEVYNNIAHWLKSDSEGRLYGKC